MHKGAKKPNMFRFLMEDLSLDFEWFHFRMVEPNGSHFVLHLGDIVYSYVLDLFLNVRTIAS